MKKQKRYAIGFWIALSIAILSCVGMVAIWSAYQAQSQGGNISITYTAYNVDAKITAEYKMAGQSDYTFLKVAGTESTEMIFDEDEQASKTFEDLPKIVLSNEEEVGDTILELRYTITYTGTSRFPSYKVSQNFAESKFGGLKIEYKVSMDYFLDGGITMVNGDVNVAAPFEHNDYEGSWSTSIGDLSSHVFEYTGDVMIVEVRISLTDKNVNASFAGAYNFILSAV